MVGEQVLTWNKMATLFAEVQCIVLKEIRVCSSNSATILEQLSARVPAIIVEKWDMAKLGETVKDQWHCSNDGFKHCKRSMEPGACS